MSVGSPFIAAQSMRASNPVLYSGDCRRFVDLLTSLAWRDVRVRYKQSLLGAAWAVMVPLSMMLLFTLVFTRAVDISGSLRTSMPYALYALSGLVPWTWWSSSLTACVNSLVANRALVTKVYFPREAFPLSCVLAASVDFCIAVGVVFALAAYFHATGMWRFEPGMGLILLPVACVIQALLTVGVGMLLAVGNLFYRDVRQIAAVGLQLLMFVSDVVVPAPGGGGLAHVVTSINPLVPILGAYRAALGGDPAPGAWALAYAALVSVATAWMGVRVFRRSAHRFAELA